MAVRKTADELVVITRTYDFILWSCDHVSKFPRNHRFVLGDVISFEALLRAAEQARKGKRFRPSVAAFDFYLEHELLKLQDELTTLIYRPGTYRSFFIYEPQKPFIVK